LLVELNNIIRNEDDEITDLKNLVYRCSDDAEKLIKALQDPDLQLVDCMTQIRDMAAEEELKKKELEELKNAAQVVVDMVDPPKEGVVSDKTLLERLRKTPVKITSYISESTRTYMEHVLGLVKSYMPKDNLEPLASGMSTDCTEDKFRELVEEVKPVAQKLAGSLDQ
jgi:hypothetical protein